MLEFNDALDRILQAVPRLGSECVPLLAARGRVLSEDLIAHAPLPPFDYSAMDGYAVCTADFSGNSPWELPLRGESRTGRLAPALARHSTCRIFTGAPIPDGADAVVMQEDVEALADAVRFGAAPKLRQNIRCAGEDLAAGSVALASGTRLNAFQIGLAAALDRSELLVSRRPNVSVLCTGDELRAPGSAPRPGSIPESNGVSLAALAQGASARVALAPRTGDDLERTRNAIESALDGSDLLLTVGGVSVGDHDVVRDALTAAGAQLDFWKVRIKPGKPLVFGRRGRCLILGLPGNPVSAQVTFLLFGLPVLRKLQGDARVLPARTRLELAAPLRQKPGRTGFYRATIGDGRVTPAQNQASGAATSLAAADALIIVPAESEGYPAGELVEVLRLSDL